MMAPESERANLKSCTCVGQCRGKEGLGEGWECLLELEKRPPAPKEPTLTCSEVVERLAECHQKRPSPVPCTFDTRKAEAILHSWRERRVQELEIALREIESAASVLVNENDFGRNAINRLVDARTKAEKVLQSDERREQIRKGANHE